MMEDGKVEGLSGKLSTPIALHYYHIRAYNLQV